MKRLLALLLLVTAAGCGGGSDGFTPIDAGVIATLATPHAGPFGAKITPDGRLLFVPLFGDYGAAGPGSTVAVYDTSSDTLVAEITVGQRPEDVDFTADGTYAYVTNSSSATVSVIHVPSLSVTGTIPVGLPFDPITFAGTYPYGIAIKGGKAYVFCSAFADGDDEHIKILDVNPASPTFNTKIGGITLSGVYTRGALRGTELVVPRGQANNDFSAVPEIAFFDTTTDTFIASIQVQQAPGGFHGMEDIAITPNGRYAYLPSFNFGTGYGEVFVIDLENRRLQDVVRVASGDISTHGVAIRSDGLLVGVTSWNASMVDFVYTPTNTVVYEFPTGANPNEIAFTPDGRKAYVTNQNSGSITVIALPSTVDLVSRQTRDGQASPQAAADLLWQVEALTAKGTKIDTQAVLNGIIADTLEYARSGEFQVGVPKDLNPVPAQVNNFTVPREGVLAK